MNYSHLLHEGTLPTFASTQQQNLYHTSLSLLIDCNSPVYILTVNRSRSYLTSNKTWTNPNKASIHFFGKYSKHNFAHALAVCKWDCGLTLTNWRSSRSWRSVQLPKRRRKTSKDGERRRQMGERRRTTAKDGMEYYAYATLDICCLYQ